MELGSTVCQRGWSETLRFHIIVKRTLVKGKTGQDVWKHYGIVTNWSLFRSKLQTVVEFQNKRRNVGNFIREQKWAYDLLRFPMQKLHAKLSLNLGQA